MTLRELLSKKQKYMIFKYYDRQKEYTVIYWFVLCNNEYYLCDRNFEVIKPLKELVESQTIDIDGKVECFTEIKEV